MGHRPPAIDALASGARSIDDRRSRHHDAPAPEGGPSDERRLVLTAALLRRLGVSAATRAFEIGGGVRVAATHHVPSGAVDNYRDLVEQMLTVRSPLDPRSLLGAYTGDAAPIADKRVAFTFDDGLLSSFRAAETVLNPLGLRAIFFVPTAIFALRTEAAVRDFYTHNVYWWLPGPPPWEWCEPITLEHAKGLHAQGHVVLPHTHTHANLARVTTAAAARREILEPKTFLEAALQSPIEGFALPYGSERYVSAFAYDAIRETYRVCFTALNGVNTRRTAPLYLHRDTVHPQADARHVANVFAGSLDLVYKVKMRRLRRATRPTGVAPALTSALVTSATDRDTDPSESASV